MTPPSDENSVARPRVSVVMSVYNGAETVAESIRHVLAQTYSDFEFIIVDDASTDRSRDIVNSFSDPRLRFLQNEINLGLTRSLNRAIAAARGSYIARIDDDDLMLPTRLARQVAYLDSHPEVGVVGSHHLLRDERHRETLADHPDSHTEMRWWNIFNNTLSNALVMFRASLFAPGEPVYDENCRYAQEYDLWTRIGTRTEFAKIPEVLTIVRTAPGRISSACRTPQQDQVARISAREMSRICGRTVSPEEREQTLLAFPNPTPPATRSLLAGATLVLRMSLLFAREPGIEAKVIARMRCAWILRVLNTIPSRTIPEAWRSGFLPLAVRAHPSLIVRYTVLRALWILLNFFGFRHPLQPPARHE